MASHRLDWVSVATLPVGADYAASTAAVPEAVNATLHEPCGPCRLPERWDVDEEGLEFGTAERRIAAGIGHLITYRNHFQQLVVPSAKRIIGKFDADIISSIVYNCMSRPFVEWLDEEEIE
jgi:hypothetical protein